MLTAVVGLEFVFYLCFSTLNNSQATADDKKQATSFISSIGTGKIEFSAGKTVG